MFILRKYKNVLDFLLIYIFILYTGYAISWVTDDFFTSIVFLIILLIFILNRLRFDPIIFYTVAIWALINLVSSFVNTNQNFSFITFIGTTLRIIMPYLILKIVGKSFIDKTIKFAYYLSLLSLVIFSIQLIFPNLFYSIAPYINFVTQNEQKENGGWFFFIYMFSAWAPDRNCGFAWEPGGFSAIITILLTIHLSSNKFKFDKVALIFILSILSTFSTSGYIALFFIFISYSFYKKKLLLLNPFFLIFFIGFIYASIEFYKNSDFMENKIETYIEQIDVEYEHFTGIIRINRFEEFNRALDDISHNPIGNGILSFSDFRLKKYGKGVGSNSIATILKQWGLIGFLVFIISFVEFYYYFGIKNYTTAFLLLFSVISVLFSNPFSMRYIIYMVYFYNFIFRPFKNKLSLE